MFLIIITMVILFVIAKNSSKLPEPWDPNVIKYNSTSLQTNLEDIYKLRPRTVSDKIMKRWYINDPFDIAKVLKD